MQPANKLRPLLSTDNQLLWAQQVIMYRILGYRPLFTDEIEHAQQILNRHGEQSDTETGESASIMRP